MKCLLESLGIVLPMPSRGGGPRDLRSKALTTSRGFPRHAGQLVATAAILFVATDGAEAARALRSPTGGPADFMQLWLGATGEVELYSDPPGCVADLVTATADPGLVRVYAVDETGVKLPGQDGISVTVNNVENQKYVIEAVGTDFSSSGGVLFCWEESGTAPCDESNCVAGGAASVAGGGAGVLVSAFPAPQNAAANPGQGTRGDPVASGSGEFLTIPRTFLRLPGPIDVAFSIYWGGHRPLDYAPIGVDVAMNWAHNYDWRGVLPDFFSPENAVEFTTPMGRVIRFRKSFFQPGWVLDAFEDVPFQLVDSGADLVLADPRDGSLYTFQVLSSGPRRVRLTTIADGKGNALAISYNGAGQVAQVTDGLGRTLTYTYSNSLLSSVSDGTRTVTLSHVDDRLASVTDPLGGVTSYAYDLSDPFVPQLASMTLPRGNTPFSQAFDMQYRVVSQSDALANTWTFSYDDLTGETTITDPLGNAIVDTNVGLRLTSAADEAGQSATLAYDAKGRRTQVTDRLGGVTSWSYHEPSGRLQAVTDAIGGVTTYAFGPRTLPSGITLQDVASITRADGTVESFAYDAAGNVLAYTDPEAKTTTFTYNARGQVLTSTDPEGGVTTYAYNADATLASVTDPSGNTTAYTHDALRRLVLVTRPDASTVAIAYDALDRVTSVTDEMGAVTSYAYDPNGNVTSATSPMGETWTYTYDAMDRLATATDPLGGVTARSYDALGRLASVTDPNGNTVTVAYDSRGRPISTTDGAGSVWTRAFDAERVLSSASSPLGATTAYVTDALGRVTGLTTPSGASITAAFDALGRMTQVTDPLARTTSYSRDARGLVSEIALAMGGVSASYARDDRGAVTSVTDPRGNAWGFAYDTQGRRASDSDPLGNQAAYTYDSRSRVAQTTHPGGLGTTTFAYDAAGRMTQQSGSDGTMLSFAYDADGRMTSAADAGGGTATFAYDAAGRVTSSNGITMTYDAGGRLASATLAPGKTVTYAYDGRNAVTSVSDWVGGVTAFSYDAAGRLVSVSRPNGVTTTISYDADSRVVGIVEASTSLSLVQLSSIMLTRDAAGHVTQAVRNVPLAAVPGAASLSLSYDAADRLVANTHDAMGRVTSDAARTYSWDLASRLSGYDPGGAPVSFARDGLGSIVARTEAAQTEEWVWNYALGLPSISIVRESAADVRYYVHAPGGLLLHSVDAASGARRFLHTDEVGSTLFLTDDSGAVTDAYAYSPYGDVVAQTGSSENRFTWHGRFGVFEEGGLYNMRARWYDPATCRFLSRDPIAGLDPIRINPYQALFGNPIAFVDPAGTDPADGGALVYVWFAKLFGVKFDFEEGDAPGGGTPAGAELPPSVRGVFDALQSAVAIGAANAAAAAAARSSGAVDDCPKQAAGALRTTSGEPGSGFPLALALNRKPVLYIDPSFDRDAASVDASGVATPDPPGANRIPGFPLALALNRKPVLYIDPSSYRDATSVDAATVSSPVPSGTEVTADNPMAASALRGGAVGTNRQSSLDLGPTWFLNGVLPSLFGGPRSGSSILFQTAPRVPDSDTQRIHELLIRQGNAD
jgi:RHS repeat-associated protein